MNFHIFTVMIGSFENARETMQMQSTMKEIKEKNDMINMIKCLLTEFRSGRKGKYLARSVRHDLGPNIFPSGPPTQSIST